MHHGQWLYSDIAIMDAPGQQTPPDVQGVTGQWLITHYVAFGAASRQSVLQSLPAMAAPLPLLGAS